MRKTETMPGISTPSQSRYSYRICHVLVLLAASCSALQSSLGQPPDTKAVLETLQRYRGAFETMDIAEIRIVWPQMPMVTEKQLKELFKTVRAIKLDLKCGDPVITGDSAESTCSQGAVYVVENDRRRSDSQQQIFKLHKVRGRWYIMSVR